LGIIERVIETVYSHVEISYLIFQVEDLLCFFEHELVAHCQFGLEFGDLLFEVVDSLLEDVGLVRAHAGADAVT
jgi:hypothetical protein